MTSLAAQITDTGIIAPSYADILTQLKYQVQSIYGSDIDLDADTQDGQMIAIFAAAINDTNQAVIAAYNAFSPATAQGIGLSSVVKVNGLQREIATNSQAIVSIVGVTGTVITNGIVGDNLGLGTQWALPATVTIPISGTIDVTATCTAQGSTTAGIGSLTQILTPTLGWQTVSNAATATVGNPVESDATLRQRQAKSTSLPAQTLLEALFAAIANVSGVARLAIYENDTDNADANGIPRHSIACVVSGGAVLDIATVIADKKTPGVGTFGTTSQLIIDQNGVPTTVNYYSLASVPITTVVTIKALTGYVSTTGVALKQAVVDFLNSLDIGEDSYLNRLIMVAGLNGIGVGATFYVTGVTQSRTGPPAAADVVLAFNEAATCNTGLVTLVVT